jgi:hypothetical protein
MSSGRAGTVPVIDEEDHDDEVRGTVPLQVVKITQSGELAAHKQVKSKIAQISPHRPKVASSLEDEQLRGLRTTITNRANEVHPRTVRHCGACRAHTPHELRPTGMICSRCREAALHYELDRD